MIKIFIFNTKKLIPPLTSIEVYVPIVVLSVNILDVKDMNSCMEDLWKYPKEAKSYAAFKMWAEFSPL